MSTKRELAIRIRDLEKKFEYPDWVKRRRTDTTLDIETKLNILVKELGYEFTDGIQIRKVKK